ncbi:MAG: isocitrate lyase/PEP mutase family protein [Planctomycetota bacterium]|jgi:2-methylisocitrate lyase-like PEP mutase family enzyme
MTKDEQRRTAEEFLKLHNAPPILVLPNAWDVVSARLFELEGFKAIGTTSAGISATLGYPDGEQISLEETIDVVRRIVEHVNVPVSADLEAGYAISPDGVARSAEAALNVGAVGVNLEDSTGDPARPLYDESLQVEKIAAVRQMARAYGVHLVINARTDVYLLSVDEPETRLRHTVQRANAYRQAGADCIFVPDFDALDRETIRRLADEIDAPLNIIAGGHTPPLAELEEIGVSRVSFGPRPMRAALALIRKIAKELLNTGTYTTMTADTMSYSDINRMFERGTPR